ncbi:MAG: glycosyltransferase, partial [Bacteroidales bacterium]|nr:glycosyltransferase [Bacteroidales bacterium]
KSFLCSDFVMRDIYYGDTLIVDEEGNNIGGRRLKPKEDLDWKSFKWGMLVCHQAILVKREIAPRYDLNYKIAADYEWVLESFKRARYSMKTKHKVSCFLRGGLSQKNIIRANIERFKIMKKYYGFFPSLWYNFLMIFRFAYTVIKLGRI